MFGCPWQETYFSQKFICIWYFAGFFTFGSKRFFFNFVVLNNGNLEKKNWDKLNICSRVNDFIYEHFEDKTENLFSMCERD